MLASSWQLQKNGIEAMTKTAFQELGFENADELATKSQLIHFVAAEIKKRRLTQAAAGEVLGLDQPNVSALVNEKISRFSVEKLMMFSAKLGFSVSIHIEGHGTKIDVAVQVAA
jgi:predicted XRE-type DNA-binding protein